jgi:hypothetical protein
MKIDDDPFADLEKLRLRPEHYQAYTDGAGEKWATVPLKIQKRRQQFVKVPWTWIERLANTRRAATFKVALYVLHKNWRNGGKPFTLSNSTVEGVSRWQKWRALNELERLKLIIIKRRKRKTPLITVVDCCTGAA